MAIPQFGSSVFKPSMVLFNSLAGVQYRAVDCFSISGIFATQNATSRRVTSLTLHAACSLQRAFHICS